MIKSTVVIGLAGQSGAGKGYVAEALEKKYGFEVIDTDKIAREITQPGSPVLKELARVFTPDIILPDGSLDRRALAALAFSSKEKTLLLNSVTHPAISKIVRAEIEALAKKGTPAVLIDAPVLFESELLNDCDFVAIVTAPLEVRLERIFKRDGISKEAALSRINAQMSEQEYIDRADVIVRNSAEFDLEDECEKIYSEYKEFLRNE